MLPPKKKRKVDADLDAVMTDASSSGGVSHLDHLLDKFVDSLEDLSAASSALLAVKDFQRTVLQQLEETNEQLSDKQSQVEKHRTTLANLQYEQGHWESKIAHLQNSCKTPQLEALCREELDDNLSDQSKVLEKFLGQDISSVDHEQPKVVAILHQQINARGTLERDLAQRHKEWLNLSNIQKKRSQFLQQLPDKLKDMEKASLPLQRFFAAASRGKAADDDSSPITTAKYNTTSDRDTRIQLAQQLAGPLYTLFVQLQSYLDDYPQKNMSLDVGPVTAVVKKESVESSTSPGTATNTIWKDPSSQVVLWQIPIPQVPALAVIVKPKFLTLAFTYFEAFQLVTVKVINGGEDKLELNHVLQLTPQDKGDFQVQHNNNSDSDDSMTVPLYGKPYVWCNYLAGLQILGEMKPPPSTSSSSSRVIVAELLRHLQANATLHYILHKLLPSYPRASALPPSNSSSNSSNSSCLAKVTSFQSVSPEETTMSTTTTTTTKTYKIVCKRGNHSLSMTVQLDPTLYPVVSPPVWSLTGNTLQWGQEHGTVEGLQATAASNVTSAQPPLHQARLAAMEAKVNDIDGLVEALKKKTKKKKSINGQEAPNDTDDTDDDDDDTNESYYYDWILTHQLREIMMDWEEWILSDGNPTTANNNGGETTTASTAVRTVRGRDRAKVE